jgi:signal transduction histidine kinase
MHALDATTTILAATSAAGTSWVSVAAVISAIVAVTVAVVTGATFIVTNRFQRRDLEKRQAETQARLLETLRYQTELQQQFLKAQTSSINVNVERIAEDLQSSSPQPPEGELQLDIQGEKLIREISHSLNTPLAQIELALRGAWESQLGTDPKSPNLITLNAAEESVQLCRAVLAAYRDLTSVARVATHWDITDLEASIQASINVFITQNERSHDGVTGIAITPKALPGYSNYMVISLLLPLLQNAVEGASPHTEVRCWTESSDSAFQLKVSNTTEIEPDITRLEEPGYSSKGDGHEGLGLSSVRTLLLKQSRAGAVLEVSAQEGSFTATINLPRRKVSQNV